MKNHPWQIIKNVLLFKHPNLSKDIKIAYDTRIRYLRYPKSDDKEFAISKALWIFDDTVKKIIRDRNEKRIKKLLKIK